MDKKKKPVVDEIKKQKADFKGTRGQWLRREHFY